MTSSCLNFYPLFIFSHKIEMLYLSNVAGNDTRRYHDYVAWLLCLKDGSLWLYKIEVCQLERLQLPGNSLLCNWSAVYVPTHSALVFEYSDLKVGSMYLKHHSFSGSVSSSGSILKVEE